MSGSTGDGVDVVVKLSFVNDLPDRMSKEPQQMPGVMKPQMSHLLTKARVLAASIEEASVVASTQEFNAVGRNQAAISTT